MLLGWQTAGTPGLGDRRWGSESHLHFSKCVTLADHSASPHLCLHFWKIMRKTQGHFFFFSQIALWSLVNWWIWRQWDITEILALHSRYIASSIFLGSMAGFVSLNSVVAFDFSPLSSWDYCVLIRSRTHTVLNFIYLSDDCFTSSSWPLDWVLLSRSLGSALRTVPWWGRSRMGREITVNALTAYTHQRVTVAFCDLIGHGDPLLLIVQVSFGTINYAKGNISFPLVEF